MKKLLLLTFLLFSLSSFAQLKDTTINKKFYIVKYSQEYQQPLWLTYKLTNLPSVADRAGITFYKEKGIVTSDNGDYSGNKYDKGHLAAAEQMSYSKEAMYASFSYLNSALQDMELNRGLWKVLEAKEREWVKKEDIEVKIEVIFDKNPVKTSTGAVVPIAFIRTVKFVKSKKVVKYKFPNKKCEGKIEDYIIK